MNQNCDIVRDLLPLYLDGVCSEASGRIVEDHLNECPACRDLYSRMSHYEIETAVAREKDDVLRHQESFFRRKSALVGTIIAGIFMIPILICLIVNLATGHGMTWFFIVLFSLLVASSLTVVPLMFPENKALWTLGSFTASLLLLIGVCSLYTHGRFFFVAAAAILFGFSVVFLPFVIRTKPVRELNIPYKGLIVMTIDTVFFILLLLTATLRAGSVGLFGRAFAVAMPFLGAAWVLFLILYFARCGKLVKAGICAIMIGGIGFSAEAIVNRILGLTPVFPAFLPFRWTADTIDGNVKWLILLTGAAVGIILILIGVIAGVTKSEKK